MDYTRTTASDLARFFSTGTRNKGASYARNGRVTITTSSPVKFRSSVRGSGRSIYGNSLQFDPQLDNLHVHCDCPHYDGGAFCKHLWATLLKAEKQGWLDELEPMGPMELVHVLDEEDYEENYDEVYEAPRFQAKGSKAAKEIAVKSNGAPEAARWREVLKVPRPNQASSDSNPLGTRGRRVLFMLDVSESFDKGMLVIELYDQRTLKNGSWGKAKPLEIRLDQVAEFDAEDQELLRLVLGHKLAGRYSGSYFMGYTRVELSAAVMELIGPQLASSERLAWVLSTQQAGDDAAPLDWDPGPAWRPRLCVSALDGKEAWHVEGELYREQEGREPEVIPLAAPVLLLSDGIVMLEDRLARLDPAHDFRWVQLLRKYGSVEVPNSDRQEWLEALYTANDPIEVVWPDGQAPQREMGEPTGLLRVHPRPDQSTRASWQQTNRPRLYADVFFRYGEELLSPSSPMFGVVDAEGSRVFERNLAAEAKLVEEVQASPLRLRVNRYQDTGLVGGLELEASELGAVVAEFTTLGWQVEAEGHKVRTAGEFNISVTSGVDWFDVSSEIDFGEAVVSLPALLEAARSGEQFVTLDDGSRGMLPQEWVDRFAPLAEMAERDGDRLRFRPSQAMLLDAWLDEQSHSVEVQADVQFKRLRKQLGSFAGVKPAKPPRGFRGELRPYQQQGLGWLKFLESIGLGGCLADDMGLGKTVQVLALLLSRRQRRLADGEQRLPSLVVAPKSVVFNWQLEAERFAPTLEVINFTGLERKQYEDALPDANVILTTYGTLRRDIEMLRKLPLDYVVLDEAQAIKNDRSQSAKACRLLDARHRLTLTGTPIENHLGELWSQLEFLNPGMLGRSDAFRRLSASIQGGNDEQQQQAARTLRRGLGPCILRRTKDEVLSDLPEKNEQTLYCELLPKDRKQYDQLRHYYREALLKRIDTSGINKAKMHILEALLRLRQAACHPGLIDKKLVDRPSAKLETLLEQLTEVTAEGHKALVFSQFTSLLSIARKRLDERGITYEYLDGRTRKRQAKVDRFQQDESCTAFLISLKAGGTGLNLTAADYVFLLDPWWNPAVEAQAIDRAHRIGQTRRVFAYRLIARDTVEEKVLELQSRKRKLADAVISGNGAGLRNLSVDDLKLLLD